MKLKIIFLAFIGMFSFTKDATWATPNSYLMTPLVPFNLSTQAPITLGNYAGKVLLVDFWATWCLPCRVSFPFYEGLQKKYGAQGLQIIGVNNEDDMAAVKKFYTNFGITFLIVKDTDNKLGKIMNPEKMPTSYIIDRKGNIAFVHPGFFSGDDVLIENKVKEILAK